MENCLRQLVLFRYLSHVGAFDGLISLVLFCSRRLTVRASTKSPRPFFFFFEVTEAVTTKCPLRRPELSMSSKRNAPFDPK